MGSSGILQGSEYIEYPPFEDAPQEGDYNLLFSIFTAIAAVAVVAVVAFAIIGSGGLALGLVVGGATVFAGCVVYSDYQNGNLSDFGTYLAAAISGAIVGAISYMFFAQAALAIKTIAGGAQFIGLLGAQIGIPFLMTNAPLLASIAGYGLAGFFGIQGVNYFLSALAGSENVLLAMIFGEGTPEFYQALGVYNDVALLGNILGMGYLQEAVRHMPRIMVPAAEKPTPAEEASIKETVINKGQSLKDEGLTKDQLGPAVAGAYDKTTGETYTAINNPNGKTPTEIHPIIKDRIDNMPPDVESSYINTHGSGSHAEVYAANEALLANPNASPEDITIYVNRTLGPTKPVTEIPFHTCPHCNYILQGFNIISD